MGFGFNPIVPDPDADTTYSSQTGSGLNQTTTGPLQVAFGSRGLQRIIGRLTGANFNTTADQEITIDAPVTKWALTSIMVTNASGAFGVALGGFYTGAGKSGTTLVAATQVYTALTSGLALLPVGVTAAALATVLTATTIYFSLTLPQGGNSTADINVLGVDLS